MPDVLYMVIACFNEEEVLPETASRLKEKLGVLIDDGKISPLSRVVFVDDGSKDRTWEIISELNRGDSLFSGISLARNSGEQNAILAGLSAVAEYADMTITMDADLQHDINAIDKMLEDYYNGSEIVFGVCSQREKDRLFKRKTEGMLNDFMSFMGVELVADHSELRLMSRRAVKELMSFDEVNIFLPAVVMRLGFKSSAVSYERMERFAGKAKYSPRKLFRLAGEAITSFSVKPIRATGFFCLFAFLAALGCVIAMIVRAASGESVGESLPVISSVLASAAFTLLAVRILGEYSGKTYYEIKRRPRFIVEKNLVEEDENQR